MDETVQFWKELAECIAKGQLKLDSSDLLAINDLLKRSRFNLSTLPDESTIEGTPQERKDAIFDLAQKIWGITPEQFLSLEQNWLRLAREKSGSQCESGKDKLSDVITAEIMIRIVAAAFLLKKEPGMKKEIVESINLVLSEACTRGRTRMNRDEDGVSDYAKMKRGGLMIGSGGGKYLPYPEVALPEIFVLLLGLE